MGARASFSLRCPVLGPREKGKALGVSVARGGFLCRPKEVNDEGKRREKVVWRVEPKAPQNPFFIKDSGKKGT